MAFDLLFVLGCAAIFTGAIRLTRAPALAAGALDATENALLATYAARSSTGAPVDGVPVTALYAIAALKTAAAMTAAGFDALALPTTTRAHRAMAAAFVLISAAGTALPALGPVEPLPIELLTVLLLVTFRARLRATPSAPPIGPVAPSR
ncbi:hypothetical protein ACWDXD_23355 [Streptomyces sp. NPDC003314]